MQVSLATSAGFLSNSVPHGQYPTTASATAASHCLMRWPPWTSLSAPRSLALAPLDQCHGGGKDATRALAHQVEVTAGMRGLDGGGGLGGAARMPLWPLSRDLRPALLLAALP